MKDKKDKAYNLILESLKDKSVLKQEVFENTKDVFKNFKEKLLEIVNTINDDLGNTCEKICIETHSKGEFEAEIKIAGDVLLFHMHTNVFFFDRSHPVWSSSYVKEEPKRAYCGMIMVYNFLSDSLKYKRLNDSGYLVARIFINNDKHFFVEGKRQLGYLYNDFGNKIIDQDTIEKVIHSTLLYTLNFDLLTPSYSTMQEVSVQEINELSDSMIIRTGKRLGFKFQADTDNIE